MRCQCVRERWSDELCSATDRVIRKLQLSYAALKILSYDILLTHSRWRYLKFMSAFKVFQDQCLRKQCLYSICLSFIWSLRCNPYQSISGSMSNWSKSSAGKIIASVTRESLTERHTAMWTGFSGAIHQHNSLRFNLRNDGACEQLFLCVRALCERRNVIFNVNIDISSFMSAELGLPQQIYSADYLLSKFDEVSNKSSFAWE